MGRERRVTPNFVFWNLASATAVVGTSIWLRKMAFHFEFGDSTVQDGLRRIAIEQIDKAIGEIDDTTLGTHKTVHQIRKRCKKLRGLVRLVRPVFGDYSAQNAVFRDAAGAISFVRDTEALIETYDALVEAYDDQIDRRAFASIRRQLTMRQKDLASSGDTDRKLTAFRDTMERARKGAARWTLDSDEFDALEGGVAKTYKRARKAMTAARERPSPEIFHEWRKRAKYHWYHARLLKPIWHGPMKAYCDAADDLNDVLGDHHDLAVFRQTVGDEPHAFGSPADVDVLFALIGQRQADLSSEAFNVGGRLLAEPAKHLTHRWKIYWNIWRRP